MTEDDIKAQLTKDPKFQSASREEKVRMATEAMRQLDAPAATATAVADDDDNFDVEAYLQNAPTPPDEGYDPGEPLPLGSGSDRADLTGTLGGIAGAQLGGPLPPARAMGAFVGGTVGNLAGRTSQDLEQGGLPQAVSNFSTNLTEAAKTGLLQGTAEMAFPVVGQLGMAIPGVKQGLQRVGGAVAKKVGEWIMPKQNPETEAMAKRMAKEGSPGLPPTTRIDPTRGEEPGMSQMAETLAYHAWFGGPLKHTYQVNEQAANQAFDRFTTAMRQMAPKDFEATARDVITGRIKQNMREPMDRIYDNIRQRAPGNIVEADSLIRDLRNKNSKMGNIVINGLRNIRESAKNPGEIDQLIALLDTPKKGTQTQARPKLTLEQALRLKTQLNQLAEGPTSTDPDVRVLMSTAGRLAEQVEQKIQAGLATAQTKLNDPTLLTTYTKAAATYARLAEKYQNKFVVDTLKAIDDRPGTLANLLLPETGAGSAFANNPGKWREQLDAFKAAYGPRWNTEVRPLIAATLSGRAFSESAGRYDGAKLTTELNKYGKENIDALLGPKTADALMQHAKTLERVAERPTGPGVGFIKIAQASAVLGGLGSATGFAFTGDYEDAVKGGSATILIAPWVLGHLYGNPALLKAFDSGLLQFQKTRKVPSVLMTTLRQAAATAGKPTLEAALTTEPPPSFIDRTLPNRPAPTTE